MGPGIQSFAGFPHEQEEIQKEVELIKQKWGSFIEKDPFYSPNLSKTKSDFSIKNKNISHLERILKKENVFFRKSNSTKK